MFILDTADYVPNGVVDNDYFSKLLGKTPAWFEQRTGIKQRSRAGADENVQTMALASVAALRERGTLPQQVDLIIAGSYTPIDTIGTLAHVIQRDFRFHGAKAIYLSTACSSFLDGLDIASMYFRAGRASKALLVAVEHNSAYARDDDITSGHLWGDGAAAVVLTAERTGARFEVLETQTTGLGDQGQGPEGVSMTYTRGLQMPHGRDVFQHACIEMARSVRSVLAAAGVSIEDVRLLVPHQANKRILDHVAEDLGLPLERTAVTVDQLGNTGCASVAITLHRFAHRVEPGQYVVLVTFGGGYSSGAALLRRIG